MACNIQIYRTLQFLFLRAEEQTWRKSQEERETLATLPGETVMTLEFNLSSLTVRNTQSLRLKSVVLYSPPTCHSAAGGHAVAKATHDSLVATAISSELTRWLEKLRWRQAKDAGRTGQAGDAVDELFTFPFVCSNFSSLSSNDTSGLSSHFRLEVVSLLKPFPRQRRNIHVSDTEKYTLSDFTDPNNSMEAEIRQRRLNKRNPSDCTAGRHGKACCRKPLTVSLKDLKIPESILAPHEIQLGYCEGRCTGKRLPFDSNWAIFRNILFKSHQQQGKKGLPRLCCVPTKFDDLDVIQFHPEKPNELKVTVIHNALVKECGCS